MRTIFRLTFFLIFFGWSVCQAQQSVEVQELVVLTGDEVTTDEMFGPQHGNFHPFLYIQGEYTDNVYNLDFDEQTNFLTRLSANAWFITPKADRVPIRISSYNTSVGGSRYTLPGTGSFERFQAYLLGGVEYKNYSMDSELNYFPWYLEGMIQYNLPSGISLRIMDKFIDDRDRIDIGSFLPGDFTIINGVPRITSTPSLLRPFISNQARLFVNVDMSEKITGHLDFANYYLDYKEDRDHWLDRMDNILNLYLYYNHSPKTKIFGQVAWADVSYETATYNDNTETFGYLGVKWQGSIKSALLLKGGYQSKDYDLADHDDTSTFSMEAWYTYLISEKTKIAFKLMKALEETDTALSSGKDTISARFDYDQNFSERFRWYFRLRYENYDYEGFYLPGQPREDHFFSVRPAVQYDFNEWLMAEVAYSYEQRNSNIDLYDFTTNTLYLSLNTIF